MRAIDADELLNPTDGLEHVKHCEEYGDVVLVCDIVYAPTIDVPERNVGKWIPVTERLPERYGRFIVTIVPDAGELWKTIEFAVYSDLMGLVKTPVFWKGSVGKSNFEDVTSKVTAWMPLPEPYREETKC